MKGLKLINSFELRGNKPGWAADTAACLFLTWTRGPGVWVYVHRGLEHQSHTCHWLCAFVVSVHRCEVGSAKDQTVCISVRAKIRLKTTEQDIRVKDWVHSTLTLMSI